MKTAAALAAIYFFAANLTGGHYYNHRCVGQRACGIDATIVAIAWPLYWPARISVAVTK